MGTATGFTADRMLAIEAASVVDGDVVGDNLVLTRHDGSTIPAGNVRGPAGTNGINGDTVWASEKLLNKNAYFEILNGANFATWYTFWQTNGGTVSVETTPANVYEGTQSARMNVPNSGSQRVGTNVFVSPAFQMIRVRARVKADGTVTASLNFCSAGATDADPDYFATGTTFLPDQARTVTAADGWVLLEGVFIVPAGKAKSRAWVSCANSSGAALHMWVDAVEVIPVVQSFIAANPFLQNFHAACNTSNPIASISVTVQEQSKIQLSGYATFYTGAVGLKTLTATCNGVTSTVGELFFNEVSSHKAVPINGLFGPLPAGTYTITFQVSGVALDANDFYNITAREILPVGWQAPTLLDSGWITVGAAGAPAFQNGWVNFDAYRKVQYRKLGDDVSFRGIAKNGTVGNVPIFTLPTDFRPPLQAPYEVNVPVTSNNGYGTLSVNAADGAVMLASGSAAWVDLSSVRFSRLT